jgi:hypothetical protein
MLDPVMLDGDSKDADFKAARDPKCRAGMSITGLSLRVGCGTLEPPTIAHSINSS